jgi:hypothetical protein
MGKTRILAGPVAAALAAVLGVGACSNDDNPSSTGAATAPDSRSAPESLAVPDSATPATESTDEEQSDTTLPTLLPTAPERERVDLEPPTFSNPTTIDNPLFPISDLHSAILLGNNEGRPIKVETTLLAEPKTIEIDGERIDTLQSQFMAYEDGRIHEVAIDWYAQADDGSVWYLGEDVYNYEDGVVADTNGSWMAGTDGPVAMIMPADPHVGDVSRPENIPGVLLEEVTVNQVGVTVNGPRGPVEGAIVAEENHTLEGVYEDKYFAPGYGEFFSGVGDSLEGMSIAVPTDAQPGPVPGELESLSEGALAVFNAAEAGDWEVAAGSVDTMNTAWAMYQANASVPRMLGVQMDRALLALGGDAMVPAVDDRNVEGARNAALDVAQAGLDLQLQFRPATEIDRARFELWALQLVADAGRLEAVPGFVAGDVTTLEWTWDRVTHTLDAAAVADIEAQLAELRAVADDEDVAAAAKLAPHLVETVAALP